MLATSEYDLMGRMTGAAHPSQAREWSFDHDALGRLLSEAGPLGTVASQYRDDGARTHITYPGGAFFETVYNLAGAPTLLFEGDQATGSRLAQWQYDTRGRVIDVIQGRNAEPGRVDWAIGYDAVSRVSSIAIDMPAAASPGDLTIGLTAYNPARQIATRTRSNAAYAFDDPVEGSSDYSHATAPASPNGLNQYRQITGIEPATIGYDGRGNLTFYNAPTNPEDRVYEYDALNRMTSATVGGATTTFIYDPLGRLYEVEDASGQGHRYLWDGGRIIARYDDSPTPEVRHRWVHAPGSLGAPLVHYPGQSVGDASRRFLQTDERGSVIAMVDGDNGAQAAINSYDPYGRPGDNNNGDFQYAGQLWIEEAELYYMRNRMYDPVLGRFVQADPIGFAGGMNLYAYVRNDPTNYIDPTGLTAPENFAWGLIWALSPQWNDGPVTEGSPIDVVGDRCRVFACPPPWVRQLVNDIVRGFDFERAARGNEQRTDSASEDGRCIDERGNVVGDSDGVVLSLGGTLDAFVGYGVDLGLGAFYDTGTGDFGLYLSQDAGAGIGGGVGIEVAAIDADSFFGSYDSFGIDTPWGSGNLYLQPDAANNPSSSNVTGVSGVYGPGAAVHYSGEGSTMPLPISTIGRCEW